MEKSAKRIIIKGAAVMVIVALAGFFLFNGFSRHPYTVDELEGVFRAKAAEQQILSAPDEQVTLVSKEYGNSITFAMQTKEGERACATYGRSVFFDKYKELDFYSGVNGVLALDDITYTVSDGAVAYEATVHFGEEVDISFGDEVRPILYIKFMAVCLAAMGIFGCRIFMAGRK
ncbi:hypothetical protein [Anaerotignum sp.]